MTPPTENNSQQGAKYTFARMSLAPFIIRDSRGRAMAQCHDPITAQQIIDALNEREAIDKVVETLTYYFKFHQQDGYVSIQDSIVRDMIKLLTRQPK